MRILQREIVYNSLNLNYFYLEQLLFFNKKIHVKILGKFYVDLIFQGRVFR